VGVTNIIMAAFIGKPPGAGGDGSGGGGDNTHESGRIGKVRKPAADVIDV
jgi:hypothetical protein